MAQIGAPDSPSAPSLSRRNSFVWAVTPAFTAKYAQEYKLLVAPGEYLTGDQARVVLVQSKIPTQDLAVIWTLSDRDKDNKLSFDEFLIAQMLIAARKQGSDLPQALPAQLLASLSSVGKNPPADQPGLNVAATVIAKQGKSSKRPKSTTLTSGAVSAALKGKNPAAVQLAGVGKDAAKKGKTKKWAVGAAEKKRYKDIFDQRQQSGFISGPVAVQLFSKSKLPREDLAKIWALSDMDADNNLSSQEFIVAMHLITKRVNGEEIPDAVPSSLVLSASSSKKKKEPSAPTSSLQGELQPIVMQSSTSPSQPDLSPIAPAPTTPILSIDVAAPRAANGISLATPVAVAPGALTALGVSEKLIDEYDSLADIAALPPVTDLDSLQQLQARLTEETRSLKLAIEKQKIQGEALKDKLADKQDETKLLQKQHAQFEKIMRSFAADIQTEEEELASIQTQIRQLLTEMEQQQSAPEVDVGKLRLQRREITQQFQQLKQDFQKDNEEQLKLIQELEALKAQESFSLAGGLATGPTAGFSASTVNDYGFKSEGFDDSNFGSFNMNTSASASNLEDLTRTFFRSDSVVFPSSGAMTPSTSDFDLEDSDSVADMNWLATNTSASGLHTPSEPAMDLSKAFPAADSNWQPDFGSSAAPFGAPAPESAVGKRVEARKARKDSTSKKPAKDGTLKKDNSKKKGKDEEKKDKKKETTKKK